MKTSSKQLILFLSVILLIGLCGGCKSKTPPDEDALLTPEPDISALPMNPETEEEEISQETAVLEENDGQVYKATLYYSDRSGYTVPVMREITFVEGIGKAALGYLVAGDELSDSTLASKGLSAPLPKGTKIDLDISNGEARADIQFGEIKPASAEEEQALIRSVVNTLFEFSSVEKVRLRFNGKEESVLANGTKIEPVYTGALLNAEPTGSTADKEGKVELYFTNAEAKVLVPVFRVMADPTPALAVSEMLKPYGGLSSLLPEDCEVRSVTVEEGVATIDLSEGFAALSDSPSQELMAIKGLNMMLKQFQDVKKLELLVEGRPYESDLTTSTGLESGCLNSFQ